jgi:ABC-type arginine transport system permease subunit
VADGGFAFGWAGTWHRPCPDAAFWQSAFIWPCGVLLLGVSRHTTAGAIADHLHWFAAVRLALFRGAALALGLRRIQVFRLVIWPQALRIIIPPLGNSVNGLLKTTSVASVISMEELLRRTQILIQERFLVLELFMVAALYYLAMTTAWDFVQRRLEKRYGRGYGTEAADRR